ncbi:MAG: hypothetical protein P9X24_14995 [Candidatus Hatepunaea meridiana]|nr:hypothetical protein [Candidatus Hatepunaea meridiana]
MKQKTFDCVKMKWEIQQNLMREMKDLSPEAKREYTINKITSNPLLSRIWNLRKHRRASVTGV